MQITWTQTFVPFLAVLIHSVGAYMRGSTGIAFSIADLESFSLVDLELYKDFRELIRSDDEASEVKATALHQVMDDYVEDYEDGYSSKEALSPEESVKAVENPIGTFRLVYRLSKMIPILLKWKDLGLVDLKILKTKNLSWPTMEDLTEVADKILILHLIYDLDLKEFIQGKIQRQETGFKLRGVHCYEIGLRAMERSDWPYAIEWLSAAKNMISGDTSLVKEIEGHLAKCIEKHNKHFPRSDPTDQAFFTELVTPGTKLPRKRRSDIGKILGNPDDTYVYMHYWALCAGLDLQPLAEKSKLRCWLERKKHPTYVLAPLKVERIASEPDILQLHDFLGERSMEHLKGLRKPGLERSYIHKRVGTTSKQHISLGRTSLQTWLYDTSDRIVALTNKKVSAVTGCDTAKETASEIIQIGAYTSGAHFTCHHDAMRAQADNDAGDRIATLTVYLSNVTLGGFTVFPKKFVAIRPVKGSAILWYNLYRDGTADNFVAHCGCPVILGEKWVATKWIRLYDQFHTHKCSLQPRQRFQTPD